MPPPPCPATPLTRYGILQPRTTANCHPVLDDPLEKPADYRDPTAFVRRLPAWRRDELSEHIDLDGGELQRWEDVSRRLRIPFHRGVISQFDGYGDLAELDWEGYRARYHTIQRLDRILEAEGDTVRRYQASKQADVLMLGHLFSPAELSALFGHLGYELTDHLWRRIVD